MGQQASKAQKQPGSAGAVAAPAAEDGQVSAAQLAAQQAKANALANEIGAALQRLDSTLLNDDDDDADALGTPAGTGVAPAQRPPKAARPAAATGVDRLLADEDAEVPIGEDEMAELEAQLAALEQEGDAQAAVAQQPAAAAAAPEAVASGEDAGQAPPDGGEAAARAAGGKTAAVDVPQAIADAIATPMTG